MICIVSYNYDAKVDGYVISEMLFSSTMINTFFHATKKPFKSTINIRDYVIMTANKNGITLDHYEVTEGTQYAIFLVLCAVNIRPCSILEGR